jgi:formylglycine-generating enzyme
MYNFLYLFFLICLTTSTAVRAQSSITGDMVKLEAGSYIPLYGSDTIPVAVEGFYLDKFPVTNAQYLAFVKQNPQWQKSRVKRIFSDINYLRTWGNDLEYNPEIKNSPVTSVSWFAAKAYCECQGKRLPTVNEWELAGMASETKPNAAKDEVFYQQILDWYSKPNPKFFPPVKESHRNYFGIYGMHGLVWEWVLDFNSTMLIGESRANTGLDRQLFCAGGSAGVQDSKNYVAFMRYAFRSSLKANYTVANLGFRCAKNLEK